MDQEGLLRDARAFLSMLFGNVDAESQKILIWSLQGRESYWYGAEIHDAAARFAAGKSDLYVGVALSDRDRSSKERCPGNETSGIVGFWADIDYQDGEAHKSRPDRLPLPPNEDAALELLDSLALKPTVIVHSGHGIQAWWLFKEPLMFERSATRTAAAVMSRAWQQTIAAKAMAKGWSVDSVHDLARILRIPGTINAKVEPHVPVRMIDCSGPRYDGPEDFEPYFIEVTPEQAVAVAREVGMKAAGEPRGMAFWEETIGGVGEGERDNRITSLNGKLLSLIDIEDAEAVRLMLAFAMLVNQRNKPPLPEDDVRRSFFSVMKSEKARRAALDAEQDFTRDADGVMASEGAIDQKLAILGQLLSHNGAHPLPLARVIKLGRTNSEYTFVLKDGSEIVVGPILNQALVRKAVLDYTAGKHGVPIVVPRYKAVEWEMKVCPKIAAVAEEVVIPELERAGGVRAIVEHYLGKAINGRFFRDATWEQAIAERDPFLLNGELHLSISKILSSVKVDGIVTTEKDLRIGLMAMGFEPVRVTHQFVDSQSNGTAKTKRVFGRYLKAPLSSLEQDISDLFDISDITEKFSEE